MSRFRRGRAGSRGRGGRRGRARQMGHRVRRMVKAVIARRIGRRL